MAGSFWLQQTAELKAGTWAFSTNTVLFTNSQFEAAVDPQPASGQYRLVLP
jgi:hypothetical protein